jgi:hypothetical protein
VDIFRKKCFNKIGRKFKEQKEDVFKLRLQQLNLLIRFKPGANKASRGLALNFDIWTNLIVVRAYSKLYLLYYREDLVCKM